MVEDSAFFPVIVLGVIAVFTLAVYLLWNGVIVKLLGVNAVTYWQGWDVRTRRSAELAAFDFSRI